MDTSKRRALGKGLEELFNNNEQMNFNKVEEKIRESASREEITEINLSELRSNPYQPRKVFDETKLKELSESIKEHGVFQPIIVKKSIKGYEIIAGERRVKASLIAGKETIPAIIRDFSDEDMMEIALLENLQRENLNAIEEATAYEKLLKHLGETQEGLAKRLGKSRSHITNMLGLLTLPDSVKELISNNELSMSHARVLSKLESKKDIESLARRIVNENLSVRDIEDLTREEEVEKKHRVIKQVPNKEYKYVEELMNEKLGTKVRVKKNKIEIAFSNVNDLNRILEILNIKE